MIQSRWHQLMRHWQAPDSDSELEKLKEAYSEPHRHYHNLDHIEDCLRQFDDVSDLTSYPKEAEIAIWYHDAIYEPLSSTNERDSADLAVQFLESIGGSKEQCKRVHGHIMATMHTGQTLFGDTAIVVDIDVSILGREPKEYDVYEQAIRKEYRWVPGLVYRRKRSERLQSFLDRSTLYETAYFRNQYQQQARNNLRRAIDEL